MENPDDLNKEGYGEQEEWQDNFLDEQRDQWEESTGMDYPSSKKSDSLFTLFKDVWKHTDSSKVANLKPEELGDLGISVRDCQRIALLSELLHHNKLAEYFLDQGEVTLSTSMSRAGWFAELFVTSKKFAHKGNIQNLRGSQQPKKWRLFGKNQETQEEA